MDELELTMNGVSLSGGPLCVATGVHANNSMEVKLDRTSSPLFRIRGYCRSPYVARNCCFILLFL